MKQNVINTISKDKNFIFENFADLSLLTAMGKLPGITWQDKFGLNSNISTSNTPSDIWQQGGEYTYTANTGAIHAISSSNNADNQDIEIQALTVDSSGNWNLENCIVTLQGQTKVILTPESGDPIVRVFRMQNESDEGSDIQGTVYCYEDTNINNGVPQDDTKIRSLIQGGYNQTEQLLYTIPTGYVGFLLRGEAGCGRGQGTDQVTMQYRSRRFGKVFKTKKSFNLMTGGNSIYKDNRSIKDPIPAKTDFLLRAVYASGNNMEVWGSMDILLIEEDSLDDEFLTAIGQIRRV